MTQWLHDISKSITFIGFLLLVATLLVTDSESMNGIVVAKYFWFFSVLSVVGIISLVIVFNQASISDIDIIKTIVLGFMTVVIIDITRSSNMEMMNAKLSLLVIISFFFFNIFFNRYKNFTRIFHFVFIIFALIEVIWGYCQVYAYIPQPQTGLRLNGSMNDPNAYALFLAIMAPIALYWTITLYKKLKIKYSLPYPLQDEEHVRSEIIDEILLFILSTLCLVCILSILPVTHNPVAWFTTGCGCAVVLYFVFHVNEWIKRTFLRTKKRYALFVLSILLFSGTTFAGFYRFQKDAVDERLLVWKISMNVLKEQPLLGVGIGNFPKAYGEAQSEYFAQGTHPERELSLASNPRYPLNDFLRLTIETGIIGFLLCAFLAGTILREGFRGLKKHREKLAVTGAMAAFTVAGILTSPLSSLPLAIILMAIMALCTSNHPVRYKYTRVATIAAYLVLGGIVIGITYPLHNQYQAYQKWAQGKLYYNMKVYSMAANLYLPLVETLKIHPAFFFEYGHALSETKRYEESTAILEEVKQNMADPMIYNLIGKNYQALGEYKLAEQNFQKAHYMAPRLMYSYFLLAKLYHEMGLPDKTLQCARQVIVQKPEISSKETQEMKFQMEELIRSIN